MNLLTELWEMRYLASEACALAMLFGGFAMSAVAIYKSWETNKRLNGYTKRWKTKKQGEWNENNR